MNTVGLGQDFQKSEEDFLYQYVIKFEKAFGDLHHNTCILLCHNDES